MYFYVSISDPKSKLWLDFDFFQNLRIEVKKKKNEQGKVQPNAHNMYNDVAYSSLSLFFDKFLSSSRFARSSSICFLALFIASFHFSGSVAMS